MISERFGRGSRTVDLELEAQIEVLRDTRGKYEHVLRLARALTNHFYNMVQTQHALGDTFADLSQKSPELRVRPSGGRLVPRAPVGLYGTAFIYTFWVAGRIWLQRRDSEAALQERRDAAGRR